MPLHGLRELRSRLDGVAHSGADMAHDWADDAADRMRDAVPVTTGKTRASISSDATDDRGVVTGDVAVFFIDAGTRAHTVQPKSAEVLRFNSAGRPRFRPLAHLPAVAARPFRAAAAKGAADDKVSIDVVVDAWNRGA